MEFDIINFVSYFSCKIASSRPRAPTSSRISILTCIYLSWRLTPLSPKLIPLPTLGASLSLLQQSRCLTLSFTSPSLPTPCWNPLRKPYQLYTSPLGTLLSSSSCWASYKSSLPYEWATSMSLFSLFPSILQMISTSFCPHNPLHGGLSTRRMKPTIIEMPCPVGVFHPPPPPLISFSSGSPHTC